MRLTVLLLLLLMSFGHGQVCCSPVGSGRAGGGAVMNRWLVQWPNILMESGEWHWLLDTQVMHRNPAGNIGYGPQLVIAAEVSQSLNRRTVFFMNMQAGGGELEEKVSYGNESTLAYGWGVNGGFRLALGKRGRSFAQGMLRVPSPTQYTNRDFPFIAETVPSIEVHLLQTFQLPWFTSFPDFLNDLSTSIVYQKNLKEGSGVIRDHQSIFHLSSAINTWHPLYSAPFLQISIDRLGSPPSIWNESDHSRVLATAYLGIDLAWSAPYYENIKIRFNLPVWSFSSSNGFPDGTQPGSSIMLSINTAGVLYR